MSSNKDIEQVREKVKLLVSSATLAHSGVESVKGIQAASKVEEGVVDEVVRLVHLERTESKREAYRELAEFFMKRDGATYVVEEICKRREQLKENQ